MPSQCPCGSRRRAGAPSCPAQRAPPRRADAWPAVSVPRWRCSRQGSRRWSGAAATARGSNTLVGPELRHALLAILILLDFEDLPEHAAPVFTCIFQQLFGAVLLKTLAHALAHQAGWHDVFCDDV